MGGNKNIVVNIIEFAALLFLGVILVLVITHTINGTLLKWVTSKFIASKE